MPTIDQAVIFAAGLGTRFRPLTTHTPKPLLKISERPLLYYVLELLLNYPLRRLIINTHYLAAQVEQAILDFVLAQHHSLPELIISHEPHLLNTGGTLKSLAKYFAADEAVFTFNSDSLILGDQLVLHKLADFWQPSLMKFLMLIYPIEQVIGSVSADFALTETNKLSRTSGCLPYMYTGLQIISTALTTTYQHNIFSLGRFHQSTTLDQQKYGLVHTGQFAHLSAAEDLQIATAKLHRP